MVSNNAPASPPETAPREAVTTSSNGNGNGEHVATKKSQKSKPRPAPAPRSRPTQPLPTERIQFDNQLRTLRAYAIASGPEGRGVTNGAVAKLVNMHSDTVAMSNAFYTGIGLLQRTDSGFVPCAEVVAFNRAFEWNPDTAAHKLQPVLERAWFGQVLLPRLRLSGTMEERQALEMLAIESATPPQQRKQIEMLLDYLVVAGIVQREGGVLRLMRSTSQSSSGTAVTKEGDEASSQQGEARGTVAKGSPLAAALFPSTADGAVNFHISVRVNMNEFRDWQPDRLAAFFSGIAQVLAARGKEELPGQ